MLKFTEKIKLEKNNAIVLITEAEQKGKLFWIYMEMNREQILSINHEIKLGNEIVIGEYGREVNIGWGKYPPIDVVEKISADYTDTNKKGYNN